MSRNPNTVNAGYMRIETRNRYLGCYMCSLSRPLRWNSKVTAEARDSDACPHFTSEHSTRGESNFLGPHPQVFHTVEDAHLVEGSLALGSFVLQELQHSWQAHHNHQTGIGKIRIHFGSSYFDSDEPILQTFCLSLMLVQLLR